MRTEALRMCQKEGEGREKEEMIEAVPKKREKEPEGERERWKQS